MIFLVNLSLLLKGFVILFPLIYYILHLAVKRWKYSAAVPCRKKWFLDVQGDLSCFNFNKSTYNGHRISVLFMQYAAAWYQLFKTKSVFIGYISYIAFFVAVSPEAVEEVCRSMEFHEKSWVYGWLHCWLGTGLLTSKDEKWKSRRKLLTPAFHFSILKDFLPIIHEKSMKLVSILRKEINEDFTDITTPITLCSLDIIWETTLGVNINSQEDSESEYAKTVHRVTDSLMMRITSIFGYFDFIYFLTSGRQTKKDIKQLKDFTLSVIRQKKKEMLSEEDENMNKKDKRKSLIEILLDHHLKTNELTEEDIREEVDTFTFEGHDTTATALLWNLYLIGLYKEAQDKIREELHLIFGGDTERPVTPMDLREMKYLECVIKESLRLYPPVTGTARQVDKDGITICGYPVPKGGSLIVVPFALHRDERLYPNAEVFDPDRFTPENSAKRHPFAYIPFSAGPRNCIGQKLAMMELKTVIANILRHFVLKSLDPRDVLLPTAELILRPSGPVRIKISPLKLTE